MKKLIFVLFVIVLGVGGYTFVNKRKPVKSGPVYRTMAVEKGRLVSLVNASGTLRPVITVVVGSQVSGRIAEIAADYNDKVRAGQVIARIAPETFEAREQQSLADLAVAGANVETRLAMVERAKADLKNAELEIETVRAQVHEAQVALTEARREL